MFLLQLCAPTPRARRIQLSTPVQTPISKLAHRWLHNFPSMQNILWLFHSQQRVFWQVWSLRNAWMRKLRTNLLDFPKLSGDIYWVSFITLYCRTEKQVRETMHLKPQGKLICLIEHSMVPFSLQVSWKQFSFSVWSNATIVNAVLVANLQWFDW